MQAARRRDHISHFLLRLYCCRNEEMRKWFIHHETELLRFRLFDESNNVNLSEFLDYNNLRYDRATEEFKQYLIKSNAVNPATLRKSNTELYCIPFEEALDLVRSRRVYIENGFCYVMANEMISIICIRFRMELGQSLANLSGYLPHLEEENRLLPRFEALYNEMVKSNRPNRNVENRNGVEQILPEMIDQLAVDHFPPCMRSMHESMRANHHLRHFGRLHYGLFLKSVGLSMEDALQFFREEFIQKVTPERFQREYAYNIRYNYGKEGKRVNMSAYSCAKIMNENAPGPGDSHGCPFKHFDESNLVRMLRSHRISEDSITEMVDMVNAKSYSCACTKYFEVKNPNYSLGEKGVFHPSQFFVESRKAAKGIPSINVKQEEIKKNEHDENQMDDFDDDFDDQMLSELTEQDISVMLSNPNDEIKGSSPIDALASEMDSEIKQLDRTLTDEVNEVMNQTLNDLSQTAMDCELKEQKDSTIKVDAEDEKENEQHKFNLDSEQKTIKLPEEESKLIEMTNESFLQTTENTEE